MTRLRIAQGADAQIRRIDVWWRENRPAAPAMFAEALAGMLQALLVMPTRGAHYSTRRGVPIKRVLVGATRYHLYFSYDKKADIVEIRAVWHASRGRGPQLG
ncbi:type II toxin-antitoxin system RelE/ParE family toxin [Pendulispora albinea]|uniref:type II toxin-antitoxin system RelE/ParE family toxin n=1 Tax=Pendulispora albinea TaxID=2741071 RepID=UPI00374E145B